MIATPTKGALKPRASWALRNMMRKPPSQLVHVGSLASQFALPQPSDIELDKLLMMAPHIDIEYDITCT